MENKMHIDRAGTFHSGDPAESHDIADELNVVGENKNEIPGIIFITSYPPRECGIATYSQDLVTALNNKFSHSFNISICPLTNHDDLSSYPQGTKYSLNTEVPIEFTGLAICINEDPCINLVMLQHEFGFFEKNREHFISFLQLLKKPLLIAFHTVLPGPGEALKLHVRQVCAFAKSLIVMTNSSAGILENEYGIPSEKIQVIPHGTHLVPHEEKDTLKSKYNFPGKKVLSTFGLLSSGKSIETTLDALPAIVENNEDVLFLVIGKTHPTVKSREGEVYREMLEAKVKTLGIGQYVQFINQFLPLPVLLEFLQLTDIYLFTSKDPNQAVSGTFSYAISCGCPVISTPIPHAREVIGDDGGMIIAFEDHVQLATAVNSLLNDEQARNNISSNGLHRMASTAWENSAIAHARLFQNTISEQLTLIYNIPEVNLDHVKKMTTGFGMIQFAVINRPDISSGYTLDDNSRALIALCQHFELTGLEEDLDYIRIYFGFIKHCLQPGGYFLNYVDEDKKFTEQNNTTNLADANGRAIWALGYLLSIGHLIPKALLAEADATMAAALLNVNKIYSTRAMAFIIKGLYYQSTGNKKASNVPVIKHFADRLVQMYRHESVDGWHWFESYLTYANSILPEAMLCAWIVTGELVYREIAKNSFDFLRSRIFKENHIRVISNKYWLYKPGHANGLNPENPKQGGEQPIDVAYTIIALNKFYEEFRNELYLIEMEVAFNWFLGANHLHQVIYNPCTGGCYDGLEENYVNLNQGAESTVSYLMARLTVENAFSRERMKDVEEETYHNHKTEPAQQIYMSPGNEDV